MPFNMLVFYIFIQAVFKLKKKNPPKINIVKVFNLKKIANTIMFRKKNYQNNITKFHLHIDTASYFCIKTEVLNSNLNTTSPCNILNM